MELSTSRNRYEMSVNKMPADSKLNPQNELKKIHQQETRAHLKNKYFILHKYYNIHVICNIVTTIKLIRPIMTFPVNITLLVCWDTLMAMTFKFTTSAVT